MRNYVRIFLLTQLTGQIRVKEIAWTLDHYFLRFHNNNRKMFLDSSEGYCVFSFVIVSAFNYDVI